MSTPLSSDQIREGIAKFPHWNWHWDLGPGNVVWPCDRREVATQQLRVDHVFQSLTGIFGGADQPLNGLRVLDIGCNEGLFSFAAKRLGASSVLGIEPRQDKVDQARFIGSALGVGGVEFRRMSIMDLSPELGFFDVVLLVGVLYHLDQPLEALRRVRKVTKKVLVVETQLLDFNFPLIALKEEGVEIVTNAFDSSMVQIPSERALRMMLAYAGFSSVARIPQPQGPLWKKSRIGLRYEKGLHATFTAFPGPADLCIQKIQLKRLGMEDVQTQIFFSCFRPKTVLTTLGIAFGVGLKRLPGLIYRLRPIAWILDKLRLTVALKRIYKNFFYGA